MESLYKANWPVVKIVTGHPGYTVIGTGVPIGTKDGKRWILTAAHVVSRTVPMAVIADHGNINVPCTVVDINEGHDIALVSATVPDAVGNMALAPDLPVPAAPGRPNVPQQGQQQGQRPQETPGWGGYSPDENQFRQFEAPVACHENFITASGKLLPGMSGGPVYTSRGLIGIITGKHGEEALAVNSVWLRGYIGHVAHVDRLQSPSWSNENVAGQMVQLGWQPVAWSNQRHDVKPNYGR